MARAIDPVCGMVVDTDAPAATERYESETYYFCSPECAATFRNDPQRYTSDIRDEAARNMKSGKMTAPKFGSAGSGGAEYERITDSQGRR